MAEDGARPDRVIRAAALEGVPHAFLTARQSDATRFDLVVPQVRPVFLKQVHSSRSITVSGPWSEDKRPEADAMATDRPGFALAIVTADCAPVLFADRDTGVIGAAHAGWRGAHGGVVESAVRRMEELGATRANIVAAIGPTISQDSYEVGYDLREQFEERDARFFRLGRPGKWQFDLEAYVAARLASLGLAAVERLGLDTYSDPARFYSYRRAVHRGEPRDGRQFSVIALPK